jgi:hypothetical protein
MGKFYGQFATAELAWSYPIPRVCPDEAEQKKTFWGEIEKNFSG